MDQTCKVISADITRRKIISHLYGFAITSTIWLVFGYIAFESSFVEVFNAFAYMLKW